MAVNGKKSKAKKLQIAMAMMMMIIITDTMMFTNMTAMVKLRHVDNIVMLKLHIAVKIVFLAVGFVHIWQMWQMLPIKGFCFQDLKSVQTSKLFKY